jgi:uncharacterized membrane protein
MKGQLLLMLLIILMACAPLYYLYGVLKRTILPRQSFGRFFLFMIASMALAFAYTFLVVFAVSKLYPHPLTNR